MIKYDKIKTLDFKDQKKEEFYTLGFGHTSPPLAACSICVKHNS